MTPTGDLVLGSGSAVNVGDTPTGNYTIRHWYSKTATLGTNALWIEDFVQPGLNPNFRPTGEFDSSVNGGKTVFGPGVSLSDTKNPKLVTSFDPPKNTSDQSTWTPEFKLYNQFVGTVFTPGLKFYEIWQVTEGPTTFGLYGDYIDATKTPTLISPAFDLTGRAMTLDGTGPFHPGDQVSVSYSVRNLGPLDSPPKYVEFGLDRSVPIASKDPDPGSAFPLGMSDIPAITRGGQTATLHQTLKIPGDTPVGKYDLWMSAYGAHDDETNLLNNHAQGLGIDYVQIEVVSPVPLVGNYNDFLGRPGGALSGTYHPGDLIGLQFPVYNRGGAPAPRLAVHYILSADDVIDPSDPVVEQVSPPDTAPVPAGQSRMTSATLRVPPLPPGLYRVGWVIDASADPGDSSGLFPGSITVASAPGVQPPGDLTEGNADAWSGRADGAAAAVRDDADRKVAGQSSLAFQTAGAFDTSIHYDVGGGTWDLGSFADLHVAFYAENSNRPGFQNGSPCVRLLDGSGSYFQYQFYAGGNPADILDQAVGAWRAFDIPLRAAATVTDGWRRTVSGTPDLSRIGALEVHADTWGYDGFALWVDDVGFRTVLPPAVPPSVPPTVPPNPPPAVPPVVPPPVPPAIPPAVPPSVPPAPPPPAGPSPQLVGTPLFAVAAGPVVQFDNPDRTTRYTATPFPGFTGDVRTATADFNGDGVADVVVGTGPGGPTHVVILDGRDQHALFSIDPFEASFTGGVYVAAGDLTGDGIADLVITPDEGGGPRVRVFSGSGFGLLADFFGISDPNFRGGARASVGDVNGDGVGDLVVSAGFGGGPRVAGFDGRTLASGDPQRVFADFFMFETTLRNGVYIAAGDVNGDGFADIVAGGGPGGGPRVLALDGKSLVSGNPQTTLANFFGGDTTSRGGLRVAVKNLDGDSWADILVGAGEGAGSQVTAYYGKDLGPIGTPPVAFAFTAADGFTGGVYVG